MAPAGTEMALLNPAAMEEAASSSPLVDDAGGLPQDGVDVVGNQFGTLHHFEKFRESAKFGVYQLFPFKIVEADATFLFAGLRHKFFLLGDA